MAATITNLDRTTMGDHHAWYADVSLGTYATGGVAISPLQFGLKSIRLVQPESAGGYNFVYDRAAQKMLAYTSGGSQVANSTDLSAVTARVLAIGRE